MYHVCVTVHVSTGVVPPASPAYAPPSGTSTAARNSYDRGVDERDDIDDSNRKDAMDKSNSAGRLDVLRELEDIVLWTLGETSMFCSCNNYIDQVNVLQPKDVLMAYQTGYMVQHGVLRTNCVDCLDRTNVAQFAMGCRFLMVGLIALGLCDPHYSDPSNAMLTVFMDMFSQMGDCISLQVCICIRVSAHLLAVC